MIPKLTHTEACELVESALERVGKTLAYIRLKLDKQPTDKPIQLDLFTQNTIEESNLICNINYYGAYLQGARCMALALQEWDLFDFPLKKIGSGNYKGTQKRHAKPINKAIFDLFLESSRNIEWCLHGLPDNVEIFTEPILDKKGKPKGVKAKFAKRETKFVELKD